MGSPAMRVLALYAIPLVLVPAIRFFIVLWPIDGMALGKFLMLADWFGQSAIVVLLGSIGLLYKPNRDLGAAIGMCIVAAALIWAQPRQPIRPQRASPLASTPYAAPAYAK